MLDDYHLIDSEAVHASLGFLLEHRPPGLHLVLASRSDPPLALARLRGGGQLAELRAAELRFTADEAAALLRQGAAVSGVALPDAEVAALVARTEGWAAGLQLAGMSLRGRTMPPGSWRRSPAATVMCWITWPRRCSSSRASRCARFCWRPRCWSGCQRRAVRCGHRPHRQPGAAGADGAGGAVRGAAG